MLSRHHFPWPQVYVDGILFIPSSNDDLRFIEIVRPILAREFGERLFGGRVALIRMGICDGDFSWWEGERGDDLIEEVFAAELVGGD